MKTVTVYYAKFGHTRRLSEAIAEQLVPDGAARAIATGEAAATDLQGADLVVMGASFATRQAA